MLFRSLVALIVTPWAAVRILKPSDEASHGEREDFVTIADAGFARVIWVDKCADI